MNIRLTFILTVVSATAAFTGCKRVNGKGAVVSRNYDLSGYEKVQLSNQGDVVLIYDVNQFVEVRTHENLFDALSLKVDDGRLEIGNKKGYNIGKYEELTFYVHAPLITEANISGSGNMTGNGGVAATHFVAKVSGSGQISIHDLAAQYVEGNISGSGDIVLGGTTADSKLSISGSGKIAAFDLASDDTEARISGSGDIETTTHNSLDIHISGSGNVKYKGTPTLNVNISGSGEVINAN